MAQPLEKDERFTYQEYLTWNDGERWELIDGVAYNMSPAPGTRHQGVAGNLYRFLADKLAGRPCRAFIAPTDVVLSDYDVVQPDVLVVCDQAKITPANIQGAPDLVVEVLSPSTSLKDLREKMALYEKSAVREYVVVHAAEDVVQVFRLGPEGKFEAPEVVGAREELTLRSLDITIALTDVFELPPPEPARTPPGA